MAADPLRRFHQWFAQARRAGVELPEAMTLATADASGRPSARIVLLKQADARGFVFFTNGHSRKGLELHSNPFAALVFYWEPIHKQVRVAGRIEEVTATEADAYWITRPRESQLAALASEQSKPIAGRIQLVRRWRALRHELAGKPVPRPPHWTGYRLVPSTIEFWAHRDHRLHDREHFMRTRGGWRRQILQP